MAAGCLADLLDDIRNIAILYVKPDEIVFLVGILCRLRFRYLLAGPAIACW